VLISLWHVRTRPATAGPLIAPTTKEPA
ncbi:MAG: hypothetical protein JWP48_1147, partial [Actinoallomurus sp.]|nr:hypothetical protein [Actinoallomurus sp.]